MYTNIRHILKAFKSFFREITPPCSSVITCLGHYVHTHIYVMSGKVVIYVYIKKELAHNVY